MAQTCDAPESFEAPSPSVFVTGTGSVIVSHVDASPGRASTGGGKEYWCSCSPEGGGGSCYVKMTDTTASCVSMDCSACTLNSKDLATSKVLMQDIACGGFPIDDVALAQRVLEVTIYRLANRLPLPIISDDRHDAIAPEGYDLVLERIGGRELVYLVPELPRGATGPVGPPAAGLAPVQTTIGKPKVKCKCSGEGSCAFTMDNVCVPNSSCSGEHGCSVTVSGARTLSEELQGINR